MLMTVACCALFIVFWTPYHANQMRIGMPCHSYIVHRLSVLDYYSNNGGTINGNDFVYEVVSKLFCKLRSLLRCWFFSSWKFNYQSIHLFFCVGEFPAWASKTLRRWVCLLHFARYEHKHNKTKQLKGSRKFQPSLPTNKAFPTNLLDSIGVSI